MLVRKEGRIGIGAVLCGSGEAPVTFQACGFRQTLILGALGLGLIEAPEALKQISGRLVPRDEKSVHGKIPRLETISAELRES